MQQVKRKKSVKRVSHKWRAGIVAGAAILLTGAIAYTSVGAQSRSRDETSAALFRQILARFDRLEKRFDRLERILQTSSTIPPPLTTVQPAEAPTQQAAPKSSAQTTDECILVCKKENEGDTVAINRCLLNRCTQARPATQSTRDQCIERCKEVLQGTDQGVNGKAVYEQKLDACVKTNC